MGNVVEFAQRQDKCDPPSDLAVQANAIQTAQEETARSFVAGIEALGNSLRDVEMIVCHIEEAEARERARLRSQAIRRGFTLALQKWLKTSL
jgi:hypothetical protein